MDNLLYSAFGLKEINVSRVSVCFTIINYNSGDADLKARDLNFSIGVCIVV